MDISKEALNERARIARAAADAARAAVVRLDAAARLFDLAADNVDDRAARALMTGQIWDARNAAASASSILDESNRDAAAAAL